METREMLIRPRGRDFFIQLVVRQKGTRTGKPIAFFRAMPYTAYYPTRGQLKARITLGEISRMYSGVKGFFYDPDTGVALPGSAVFVKRYMKGKRFSKPRPKKWELLLKRYLEDTGSPVSWKEAKKILYTYLGQK